MPENKLDMIIYKLNCIKVDIYIIDKFSNKFENFLFYKYK